MGLFDSTQTTEVPKWIKDNIQRLNKRAEVESQKKFTPYDGKLVADKTYWDTLAGKQVMNQRNLAGDNFNSADRLLGGLDTSKKLFYGGAKSALGDIDALSGDYFKKAGGYLDGVGTLSGDYFKDAGNYINNLNPLSGDYFSGSSDFLKTVDRGDKAYSQVGGIYDAGHKNFASGMGSANKQIGEMASRGKDTQSAIKDYGSMPGMVKSAQGKAEGTQLGTNSGLRSSLSGSMTGSGSGFDEASKLTRRAAGLDATNSSAIAARMNPYQQGVTDKSLRDYGKQRAIAGTALTDSARAAGAFGGSRHGVAQGMFDQETSKGMSDIITDDNARNYAQAISSLNADRNNLLAAGGQLASTQGARDTSQMGYASQISDMAQADAALLRQGGLDLAGATKDAAAGKMAGDRALFDMDRDTAKMYQDLARGYSDEALAQGNARLGMQAQRYGQDMDMFDAKNKLNQQRMDQQNQRYQQTLSKYDALEGLGKNRLDQQSQRYQQEMGKYDALQGLGKSRLDQQNQQYQQRMGLFDAETTLADRQRDQFQQRFDNTLSKANSLAALGKLDQDSRQAYAADLLGYGKEMRGITQNKYNANKSQWDAEQNWNKEQLNFLSAILGGNQYGTSTTSNNGIGNALIGGISTGISALLGGIPSDKNKKTDRRPADGEEILKSFGRMPVDDYKYLDDFTERGELPSGKRTGPMAQDWQKEFGGDGKTIDLWNMMGTMAGAIKALEERTEPRGALPRKKAA